MTRSIAHAVFLDGVVIQWMMLCAIASIIAPSSAGKNPMI